jgi:glycosyltransferase involved in cell wall biosynthesis/SAM-dependent methyltransferase
MNNYGLHASYTPRLEPQYFNDTLPDSTLWQADVYRLAARLARQAGVNGIVDIGCGTGGKLAPYMGEFSVMGIDYGANIIACHTAYPLRALWLSCDLGTKTVDGEYFEDAIAICADVIEHIPYPEALIESLRNASKSAAYVLVSTPDRERIAQGTEYGPPANPAHVREWTEAEFSAWLKSEGLPVVWSGWTISYDKQPQYANTILTILSTNPEPLDLPITFAPAPAYRKPSKLHGSSLKVWMTPTPSEASRDTTNSIHQIVTRLNKHLPDYGVELVEQPDNATLYAAHAGQGSSSPIHVAHYHGLYPTAMGMDGGYFGINANVIRNLRTAKAITAPSEWIADVIRRDMHINPHVIGWGVDTDEWTPGSDQPVYVIWNKARVDMVSNPQPMLDLAARAHETLFLTTFGDGTPNVKTIGRQPYEVMKEYVRRASVYLSTNVETFGIGILEACASGVPILGFRQGAIADYIQHGVHGFLAEPGDMNGLYEGLAYCLKYRKQLGENARELAKQFTWDRVAREFAAVYRSVLEPHKGVKVSVVIPCHNYAQYVMEAVESVRAQTTTFDFEIIVVNDSSTDESADILRRKFTLSNEHYYEVAYGNLSATRNRGIEKASGEFIVCLDADDRLGSIHFLQILSDTLDADRTLGIAFTSIQFMDSDGNLGHKSNWPDGYDFDRQAKRFNQVPSCCMFRREAWVRAGGFKPYFVYAQDAEFWTQVGSLGYGAKHVVQDGWFHYRLHNKSQSQVHRTGEIPEPDWTEYYPWSRDNERPFAADGKAPRGSWPVRFYDNPAVTIIVPVGKGHEATLIDALHSVEGQTYRFWECIVVNDTGRPLELPGFPFVKVVTTRGGAGAGAARNAGVKRSHAPLVVFLDADDMLKPRFLEAALAAYKQHGKYVYVDWLTQEKQTNFQVHPTPEYSIDAFRDNSSIHPVTTLLPRHWFNAVGGFDEDLPAFEDVDLYMKMLTHGYCGVRVKEPLLIYNLNSGSRRKSGESFEKEFRALLKERYGAFMEGASMCNCVEPPKGKPPVAPTPENAMDYREAYGEMVKIQWVSEEAPLGAVTLRGPNTKVNYQRRARGDVFYIWEADYTGNEHVFQKLEDYQAPVEATIVPPPPEPVTNKSTVDALPTVSIDGVEIPDTIEEAIESTPVSEASSVDFHEMTKAEIRRWAAANAVNLGKAETKAELIAAIDAHYQLAAG